MHVYQSQNRASHVAVANYDSALNCSQVLCLLNSCWANEMTAAVARVLGSVPPVPVSQRVLSRPSQDFGITVGGCYCHCVASETTGIATSQMTTNTVDPLARQVALP